MKIPSTNVFTRREKLHAWCEYLFNSKKFVFSLMGIIFFTLVIISMVSPKHFAFPGIPLGISEVFVVGRAFDLTGPDKGQAEEVLDHA